MDKIKIIGARENNLKNINLEIPKNSLIVFTGLSGSGKSTLAFDTLYAEGQRRYIESLSSYARQFLQKTGKPEVDKIEGLTPAIAIDQKTTSKNPRSTVGTVTEIYDYLRLLYARIGIQHCHICGREITQMTPQDIINEILKLPNGAKIIIYAPLIKEKKGEFHDLLEKLRKEGIIRAYIDGIVVRLDEEIELKKTKKHTIKAVIDRVVVKEENKSRIAQAVEKALNKSFGEVEVEILNAKELGIDKDFIHFSEHKACFNCKVSFEELEPLAFSFNSPKGACPKCDGLGITHTLDIEKVIKDKPLNQGGIPLVWGFNKKYYQEFFKALCKELDINMNKSFYELDDYQKKVILNGTGYEIEFEYAKHKISKPWVGLKQIALNLYKEENLSDIMSESECSACKGFRLKPESLAVRVAGKTIAEIISMPIEEAYKFFANENNFSHLSKQEKEIASPILKEIKERLFFLVDVGLGYLTLHRDARTISGGESQRIRIASQIGSGLTGVMYVLDEPSIGLHERDTLKLINTLKNLKNKGNTVIVVEHDRETILNADYVVDIGPGAGKFGGEVIFSGDVDKLLKSDTITAKYLKYEKDINYQKNRAQKEWIEIKNVNINNIKNLNVKIPLRNLVCVTGVSGSGKSSLILQTLLPVAREILNHAHKIQKVKGVEIKGLEQLDKVIYLDQSPIGRTPRSNPATYTNVFDDIRNLFAQTPEAQLRGYTPGRFSFNVKGGRCEVCKGEGQIKIEMHFLPDVLITCEACGGKRYNEQTLEIKYKGKSIADVLEMSVDEAYEFFEKIPKIKQKLQTLKDVGLGYITLGQNATTLSGGEAQRIKLAKELSRKDTGNTLYILDEPTTGLHFKDIDNLMKVLQHLVDLGNSVIVIEHNLDFIKNADYIIDMGPEGGNKGGKVIATGNIEEIITKYKDISYTAKYLAKELKK
ncbi:MAG: excinuclease ABC subunit UvrA [Epsilonproteobacteria bacterium]|nr:excinuclease ABC subunit UvrA [Campylobacterota bacterium]